MKNPKLKIQNRQLLFCIVYFAFCFSAANAQSTRIEFPTPLTSSEINGRIPARDIGDSRLTRYYYTFNGNQGDIFLKIQATNLNGDIDIFYADNMRPLTKVSLYADSTSTQTGREIYLRKPEKLILRVEGRTPNDDAAIFSIKFEGSFQPLTAAGSVDEPENPTIKNEVEGSVRVNSVGTIIEPEPKPESKRTVAAASKKTVKSGTSPKSVSTADEKDESEISSDEENLKRSRVIVSDNIPENTETKLPAKKNTMVKKAPVRRSTRTAARTTARKAPPVKTAAETKAEELAKALENIRLVVLFKDGGKIERQMNEVLRFNVDKGVLTIISKDGSISRHSILDVIKIAIE